MFLSNRSASNSVMTGLLLKARQFGVFSIVALTSTLVVSPLATQAQITTDGSTATEVKGNVIAPTGQGTVNGGNLYNSFDKFNVPTSGVIFNTGTSSVDGARVNNIINRVTGDTPSSILGTIESRQAFPNANLYLLNPNGIVFGVNSRLDIGGSFYANTGTGLGFDQSQKFNVDKNSLSFPSGDPTSIQFAVAQPAAIINQGNLSVDAGKNISLTAGTIINTGNLSAPAGNVNVAAVAGNSQVELRSPDLVLGLAVTKNAVPTTWNGTISTLPKLAELLTGKAVQADQVVVKPDGSIALVATPNVSDIVVKDGMAIASGAINVSSNLAKGGNIGIFGDQVGLVNAQINASGITGGGTVLIGGNLQGKGIAPNALQTYVDASSNILANGLLTGDGGRVIVWSDRSTQFYGAIAARGGDISGNGGFVEVSGKENLDYRGNTDTRALNGATGTLLLDPTNITVAFSGSATLNDVSAFSNAPTNATISSSLIDSSTSNIVLQATNDISFGSTINVVNLGVGITAQAGGNITVNSPITTNRGNFRLIANDPAFATGTGNIIINAPITTNGGVIDLQASGTGSTVVDIIGDLSSGSGDINVLAGSISISGNISSGIGSINVSNDPANLANVGISIGGNTQITSGSGSITLNGRKNIINGSAINISSGATIASTSGTINISGQNDNALFFGGDGILINSVTSNTTIQTNGNINFTGSAANPSAIGINIQPPSGGTLTIDSGSGNLTFTSDKTAFPNIGFGGSGVLTLQPLNPSASLVINGSTTNASNGANKVFLDSSFLNTLSASNPNKRFTNVVIGNSTFNNSISLAGSLFIATPIAGTLDFAPVSIRTSGSFNGNGNLIDTSTASLNLVANQGITALGNITASGGNVTISSSLGNIISSPNTVISTATTDSSGGDITITANSGLLDLGGLDAHTSFTGVGSSGGNITLTVTGNNNISVGNIISFRSSLSTGAAGTVTFAMGTGNITLTGSQINLDANIGNSTNLVFPRPVNFTNPLTITTTGTTANGNVTFNNTVTSSTNSSLNISTGSGNVTFGNAIASSTQPLGDLTITSTGTTSFASTVFASGINSNFGNTIINADLVATGTNGITLRNFTVNGNVSLVGDEIDFNGTASGTGNLTLKPVTVNRIIAIGGAVNINGFLSLTNTDLAAFAGGTFNSLTIGNLLGTGAITLQGNVNFAQPTTIQSPVGTGSFGTNGFDILGTGRLAIEVGSSINIANSTISPTTGTLNVRLNADRDGNGGTVTITNGSLINTGGDNITIGGGLNPIVNPALATGGNIAGVTINGSTLNAVGGNIVINGASNATFGTNNNGILITNTTSPTNSRLSTSGAGLITLSGISSTGGFNNRGILIDTGTIIESVNGNITFNGTGNGTGNSNYGIGILNDPTIRTTGSGSLNLLGISNGNGEDNTGIIISRANLNALGNGTIILEGQSGSGGFAPASNNIGVSLSSNSTLTFGVISTNNGNISITGTSRGTRTADRGVLIGANATVIALNSGNVNIVGTGGNGTGSSNQGVAITGENAVVESSNGNLTLNGTGNGTLNFNHGIAITNSALVRTTGTGTLNLTGVSNSTGLDNDGIFVDQSTVTTTNTGNIFLTGTSGTGNSQSAGISISGNSILGLGTISSINGSITLSGTSRAVGNNNQGVVLNGNATITATNNTNNISITGTGGLGTNNNQGILVDQATSSISIGNGALTLIGTGRGTGTGNDGIAINAGNIDALGTGSITFTGFAPANSFGILLSTANIKPTNTSGLLRFSADEIDSNGLSNIRGTGLLFIEPVTATRNIVIGGTANPNDGNLEVSNAFLGDLLSAFSQIFIGRADSSGLISLAGNANFANSLTLRSPVNNGSINTSGFNITNTGGSITFLANQNITTGNITNAGNAIALTSTTGLINTAAGTLDTSSNVGNGGTITFSSSGGSTIGNLNTSSTVGNSGAIAFSNGNITINGSIINVSSLNGTVPNLNFAFPVILNSPNLTITATTGGTNGGVSFANNLSGTTAGVNNLTINAGAGNITFSGAVGSNTIPLGNLIANSTGITSFVSTVNANSLVTNAGGTTRLNGNVTTTASQTYNDTVEFSGGTIQLNTTNSPIAFNSNTISGNNVIIDSGSGNVTFSGAVGLSSVSPFGALTVNSTGTTRFNSTVDANSLTTNAGGTTELNGNITTNGTLTFNDQVTLTAAVRINTTTSPLVFGSTVNGNQDLIINAVNYTFNGAVGNLTPLGNLTLDNGLAGLGSFNSTVNAASLTTLTGGSVQLNGNITTTGTQTYNNQVILNAPVQFNSTNSPIAFNSNVNGTQNLTVNTGNGNITFATAIGNTNPIGNIIANSTGATRFNTVNAASITTNAGGNTELNGNITTTGAQTYNDAVDLTGAVQINTTNSAIAFNSTVSRTQNLSLDSGSGNITFSSAVGTSVNPLGNITVNSTGISRFNSIVFANSLVTNAGGTTELNGNVTTSASQTFNDAVTLTAPVQINTSNSPIAFNNIVDGNQDLTVFSGSGNITFGDAVGVASFLNNLVLNSTGLTRFNNTVRAASITTNVGGSTEVNGNITTFGNQTFNDNVIIGIGATDVTFDADSNSDSDGTFSNLGAVNGTGKNISIRSASLNIGGDITADKLTLIPSIPNPTIAIGSSASGNFVISDTTIPFLKANLVAIAANNNNVNIDTNQPFANGTSLEIGTAASPANSIITVPNFTRNFNINGSLSLAASNIQLGNTTVGGDLTFIIPTTVGQSTGSLVVNGTTLFLINDPNTDIILRRNNLLNGGVRFINTPNLTMRDLELNNNAENSSIINLPSNFRNLVLTLANSTINLSGNTTLTGRLVLTGRDVIIDQDLVATEASLNGGNITINRNFRTTDSSLLGLSINSSGTFRINPTSNINVAGEFFDSGTGDNAIAGNINANSVFFDRNVNLVGDTTIVSDSSIRFFGSVNGAFGLTLDANGNQISMSQFGDTTPLGSLTIAPNTTITPYSIFSESQSDKDDISINVTGNITLGDLINDRDSSITLSSQGAINIGNINTAATVGNAGNVTVTALQNLTTGNINASAITGVGGNVILTSTNGVISTGDVNTSGNTGGEIFYNARTAINAGRINSSGARSSAGNVTLDPVGDVVVSSIDASSATQGGNVTLVSTGGNLKITDTIVSSINSSCIGASICTIGGSGGSIALQTGGLSSFAVGNPSINGSSGTLTTGFSTLDLGSIIPVLFGSTFTQGGISISPGGFAPIIRILLPTDPTFEPPKTPDNILVKDPIEEKLLGIRDIAKKEADRYFSEGQLDKAFDAIEKAYASELEIFTGNSVGNSAITIENTQDLLSTVAQQTGDIAVLIYPVLLNNRIEILVVPPKDKGTPFRRFTVAANQKIIEAVVTDYRNNLRDVGSNDYLEQSQKLYDWIIRPIDKELKAMKVNTLVFVMDGGLRVSPPAALHDGKQFLIERYAIANIPSIRVTRVEERDRKATRVLAMGLTESVEGFSALPAVDIEIKTISSEVLRGSFFLNKEFTVSNLQNQRQQGIYNILHLGTHAKFVSDTNKDSFIQFWDSRLRLSQIPKLRFDSPVIDMLTLSACQTAVGNNLGISGLAVESGARSVLASLWEVSDTGTAPLMISFYNAFPDAVNKAQAMQTAQISLLSGKVNVLNGQIIGIQGFPKIPLPVGSGEIDLSHPFYWSSFILVGNWL